MYEENLKNIADKLETIGIVFEMESNLCLGVNEVSSELINILKEKYGLTRLECHTLKEIDWEYYIFNYDIMTYDEAKEYALKKNVI